MAYKLWEINPFGVNNKSSQFFNNNKIIVISLYSSCILKCVFGEIMLIFQDVVIYCKFYYFTSKINFWLDLPFLNNFDSNQIKFVKRILLK